MAPPSSSSPTATSVQVALRIRPPTFQDQTSIPARFQRSVIHATSNNTVSVELTPLALNGPGAANAASPASANSQKKQFFSFDQVHPPPAKQYDLFNSTAKPLVSRFLEGFNCTILAYGQTSSGKTYTMTGIDLDADPNDPSNGMGIIPRAVSAIFASARQLKDERAGAWNFSLKASFIEIYNEDLIDLLSMDEAAAGRREVQIREDKDGHIIWGGLREMNVRNAAEVMSLIRKGTAIRRTNETDMNAQSSRSHAIFSLTLIQKKFKGAGPPPRSPSPMPTNGRSPSRLARPGSMYSAPASGRASSPTFGRPATPSFAAAMGRGGLRPASALGHRASERTNGAVAGPMGGDEEGEWVTITSKFHFVDLAGSERLKRTAAAGERIKEGISINSGLLALGNVISALGDPARSKSHTASHIPYRDSKLTRLLQDSLGGNAHTLMIACVSPAEYNANETINTLKYANRARNIKNHAVLNEKEDGWDDIDWLQTTVVRLRKELKGIKEGGGVGATSTANDGQPAEPSESLNKKMLAQMSELRNNYEDLRGKFVERTEELTRLRRELGESQRGSMGGAIVGTARYEEIVGPVIEEYEKTISAIEAELGLNKAALRHTNDLYEEKEEELTAITERHAATELYVEELRARVAKLTEREASTEAYVRDLEEKIKSYDESTVTSRESMTDLKREVSRFKDAESHSGKYITELEARLARSDESVVDLQRTVERLEAECERRTDEVRTLEARLETLKQDGDGWRSDLEARERHVKELEARLVEWEKKKDDANDARLRLGAVVGQVTNARKSLQIDLKQVVASSIPPTPVDGSSPISPVAEGTTSVNGISVESQLIALQQTHKATLADLSTISAKYRDALREISDLAAQIQEAKLSAGSVIDSGFIEAPGMDKSVESPLHQHRPRMTGSRNREPSDDSQKRLLYRQAASAESLRTRSVSQQSLSQELTTAHLRKASASSHGSSHSPSSSHSALSYVNHHHHHHPHGSKPNLSISISSPQLNSTGNERSVHSLEKEIMRLQEVLKERETEITLLEASLKESQAALPAVMEDDMDHTVVHEHQNGLSSPESSLSPADMDESLERLNELMLSMAQKESQHNEIVDELNSQLAQVQRQLDDLTTLSRDQAINMSTEMDCLRRKHQDDLHLFEEVQSHSAELQETIRAAEAAHAEEVEVLRSEHQKALEAKAREVDELVARTKEKHQVAVRDLCTQLAVASATLEKSHKEHEEAFGALKAEHAVELRRQVQAAKDALEDANDQHAKALTKVHGEYSEVLKQKDAEANTVLQRTEEEYYDALTKIRGDHSETLKKHAAELNGTLERLREEHTSEMKMAEIAREGSLSESQSAQAAALQELQDAHAASISRKEASFTEDMETLKSEHTRSLKMQEDDHTTQMDRLRLEYESAMARLKEESRVEVDRLLSELKDTRDEMAGKACKARKELETSIQIAQDQQEAALAESRREHDNQVAELSVQHRQALEDAVAQSEQRVAAMLQSHSEEISKLNAQHEQDLASINATLLTLKEEHHQNLQAAIERQVVLAKEKESLAVMLSAVQNEHSQDVARVQERCDQALVENKRLAAELVVLQDESSKNVTRVQEQYDQAVDQNKRLAEELASIQDEQSQELVKLQEQRDQALTNNKRLASELTALQDGHTRDLTAAEEQNKLLAEEKKQFLQRLDDLAKQHSLELRKLRDEHELALQELDSYKTATKDSAQHQLALSQKDNALEDMRMQLDDVSGERDELEAEVARLRGELDKTRGEQSKLVQEASKRQSLVDELERHRSNLADMQEALQKVKDEKDAIQVEKMRADSLVRDLQAQVARGTSPSSRSRGPLPPIKLPPPTPPPSVPPPPAPISRSTSNTNGDASASISSHSSSTHSSGSSRESQPESPSTSVGHATPGNPTASPVDSKVNFKLEQQAKQIEEQEAMIKTLNKQLTHCESDLQTHMDLVSTLETSLGDSEKNLRKARMHATELARERDTLTGRIQALQNELADAKREVVTVRRSIVEEKQSLEQRLDEERKAKERARQQLDQRMEELQKRKSKFACL